MPQIAQQNKPGLDRQVGCVPERQRHTHRCHESELVHGIALPSSHQFSAGLAFQRCRNEFTMRATIADETKINDDARTVAPGFFPPRRAGGLTHHCRFATLPRQRLF